MKYYKIVLEESNGEKCYAHEYLIKENDYKSAYTEAERIASVFFTDDDNPVEKRWDGEYEYDGGRFTIKVFAVKEVTLEQWFKDIYRKHTNFCDETDEFDVIIKKK